LAKSTKEHMVSAEVKDVDLFFCPLPPPRRSQLATLSSFLFPLFPFFHSCEFPDGSGQAV